MYNTLCQFCSVSTSFFFFLKETCFNDRKITAFFIIHVHVLVEYSLFLQRPFNIVSIIQTALNTDIKVVEY